MSGQSKFLLTQSLLSSWQYALKNGTMEEVQRALRREKTPQTKAMLDVNILTENMSGISRSSRSRRWSRTPNIK